MANRLGLDDDGLGVSLFPRLSRDVVWINGASRTPLPSPSLAAGLAAVRRKAETPWSIGDTEADRDAVREYFARLVGAGVTAEDVTVVPSCSYAMSLAARNLRTALVPGRRNIVVLEDQNASHVMPWQQLCAEEGGELLKIPRPDDFNWTALVIAAVERRTVAVCAVPPCHWTDGSTVDLRAVGAACAAHGTALVVDATQYVGAAPCLDAVAIGATFVAASVHKWLLGPYGACLCYARRSFWERAAPIEAHDRNREGAQHVECLPMLPDGRYPPAFQSGARRLDSGGRPS